jgi:hypothetical protein
MLAALVPIALLIVAAVTRLLRAIVLLVPPKVRVLPEMV